jgi:hypothetical protein
MPEVPKELLARIEAVTNKRARFVLDSIVKNGVVTTEEINQAGYEHPPRAARDVRELGFSLKTVKVKHSNGRAIGAYVFDEGEFRAGRVGRRALAKKGREAIIHAAGDKCQICGSEHNLQVDHRIPYEVGGEESMRDCHTKCSVAHAIERSHGTVNIARIGSSKRTPRCAGHAIGPSRQLTVTSLCNSNAAPTLFGLGMKLRYLIGCAAKQSATVEVFPTRSRIS